MVDDEESTSEKDFAIKLEKIGILKGPGKCVCNSEIFMMFFLLLLLKVFLFLFNFLILLSFDQ